MSLRRAALLLVVTGSACVSTYGERPQGTDAPAAEQAPGETIVGTVAADGTLDADTVAGGLTDTTRVERVTVVTGSVEGARPVEGRPADAPPVDAPPAEALGYRVQVHAARDRPAAEEIAARLRQRLPGEPVYVDLEDDWYKVRVGDFTTREAAGRLEAALADMGFAEAWTVRTAIRGR